MYIKPGLESGAYTGIKPGGQVFARSSKHFFLPPLGDFPPLALKMLLFYTKSTTCPLGGPFSIQGLYITMYPSV